MSTRQTFQGLSQGPNVDKKITASQSANRLVRKCILTLEQELTDETNEIELVKGTLCSVKQNLPERQPFGNKINSRCSRCHYRGHKANKPCELPECQSYFDCGFKNLHPEHVSQTFKEESKLKELQKRMKDIKRHRSSQVSR